MKRFAGFSMLSVCHLDVLLFVGMILVANLPSR